MNPAISHRGRRSKSGNNYAVRFTGGTGRGHKEKDKLVRIEGQKHPVRRQQAQRYIPRGETTRAETRGETTRKKISTTRTSRGGETVGISEIGGRRRASHRSLKILPKFRGVDRWGNRCRRALWHGRAYWSLNGRARGWKGNYPGAGNKGGSEEMREKLSRSVPETDRGLLPGSKKIH